ncbi:hypothetical protein [Kitasatospora griseola]|uniref:hypothetical protein n=1 Tax=Kitasatospora griseola TaxID=2064 RepID=UPI003817F9DF
MYTGPFVAFTVGLGPGVVSRIVADRQAVQLGFTAVGFDPGGRSSCTTVRSSPDPAHLVAWLSCAPARRHRR